MAKKQKKTEAPDGEEGAAPEGAGKKKKMIMMGGAQRWCLRWLVAAISSS